MGNELEELDWLDAKLRDEMPYIDDAGFTKQVMQKLPAGRRAPRPVRAAILLGATVLACVLAFVFAGSYVVDSAAMLAVIPMRVLAVLAVCITALVTICGGAVAFLKSRDVRL
jgi:hypothetical protein